MDQMTSIVSMISMVGNLGSILEDEDPLAGLEGLLAIRGELLAEAAVQQAATSVLRRFGRVPRDGLRQALQDRLLPLVKEPLTAEDVAKACSAALDTCGSQCDEEAIKTGYLNAVSAIMDRANEVTVAAPLPGRPAAHRNAVPTAVVPMAELARLHRGAAAAAETAAGELQLGLGWRTIASQTAYCVVRTWLSGFLLGGSSFFSPMCGGYLLESAPWLGRGRRLRGRVAVFFMLWYYCFSFGLFCIVASEAQARGAAKAVLRRCLAGNALQILLLLGFAVLLVELAEAQPFTILLFAGVGECLMIVAWSTTYVRGKLRDPVQQAAMQARALLQGSQPRTVSVTKAVAMQSLPDALTTVLGLGYGFMAILAMTRVHAMGKAMLFVVALLVKVLGNKLLVGFFRKLYLKSAGSFTVDFLLFNYEFTAGTLSRMIVLSVPDASISLAVSLASTLVELLVRMGMLHAYLVAGVSRERWTERDWVAYSQRGRLYVGDVQNDQMVEYASSAAAVSVLLFLACPAGGLECGDADGRIRQLLFVSVAQWLLEAFCDVFGTCMEVHGGLWPHLRRFWAAQCTVKVTVAKHCVVNMVLASTPLILLSGR